MDKEVERGHILGPFKIQPFKEMVFLPINLVEKLVSPGEHCLIHDLSHPFRSDNSVNACIPESESSVQYHYLDEVIQMAIQIGCSAVASRLDVKHAFRNLDVNGDDLWMLGFTLGDNIYINSSVAFGSASSCLVFERVSTILQWVVQHETSAEWLSHFLDDYILLERCTAQLEQLMTSFRQIFKEVGMPLAEEKTLGPTNVIEYLGLVLNLQLIMIPENKCNKCLIHIDALLKAATLKKKVMIKQIQKAAGTLNFLCQAFPAGRPFLQSLYKLTRAHRPGQLVKQHHHCSITAEVAADMTMFRSFITECVAECVKTVPFLSRLGIYNMDLQLFADAAGNYATGGLACLFENQWTAASWKQTNIFHYGFRPNIALLEMLAIVMAVEIWGPCLAGKTIIL